MQNRLSFDPCSAEHAAKVIAEIRASNLKCATVPELMDRLLPLFHGYQARITEFSPGLKIFRAVKWHPKTIRELSYPPTDKNIKSQRANDMGKLKFYGSSSYSALFFETRSKPQNIITIGHWRTTGPLHVNPIGYSPEVFRRRGANRGCPPYAHADFVVSETHGIIREFFCEEFTRDVCDTEEHLYKLTAAIAEKHFGSTIEGVLYPTMAQWCNADNFALEPRFVDRSLAFLYAERVRVDASNGVELHVTPIDFARPDAEGKLKWTGKPPNWVIKKDWGSLRMVSEGGAWTARDQAGQEVFPE